MHVAPQQVESPSALHQHQCWRAVLLVVVLASSSSGNLSCSSPHYLIIVRVSVLSTSLLCVEDRTQYLRHQVAFLGGSHSPYLCDGADLLLSRSFHPGHRLLNGFSNSGHSRNCIKSVVVARKLRMKAAPPNFCAIHPPDPTPQTLPSVPTTHLKQSSRVA